MTKIKTLKAIVKRFKITKNSKVLKRKAGQDHFNARESGVVTRSKRRDVGVLHAKDVKNIKSLMPYN